MDNAMKSKLLALLALLALAGCATPDTRPINPAAHRYGLIPDTPQGWIFNRDAKFKATAPVTLPPLVDLTAQCPPTISDQGQLGSCAANASETAFEYVDHLQNGADFIPQSRLKLYYDARRDKANDTGCQLRDVFKVMSTRRGGMCAETLWPYDIAKFAQKPPSACYTASTTNYVLRAERVEVSAVAIKTALAAGFPVVIGESCYSGANGIESPEAAQTGLVGYPSHWDQLRSYVGGHAILIVGYDDSKRVPAPSTGLFSRPATETGAFKVRNSWGTGWGAAGYLWEGYSWAGDNPQISDAWVIRATK